MADRLVAIASKPQTCPKAVVGFRRVGHQSHGLAQMWYRFLQVALRAEDLTQVRVRFGEIRIRPKRLGVMAYRFGELPFGAERERQVVVSARKLRLELYSRLEVADRLRP